MIKTEMRRKKSGFQCVLGLGVVVIRGRQRRETQDCPVRRQQYQVTDSLSSTATTAQMARLWLLKQILYESSGRTCSMSG